jgi:hypothetical protein
VVRVQSSGKGNDSHDHDHEPNPDLLDCGAHTNEGWRQVLAESEKVAAGRFDSAPAHIDGSLLLPFGIRPEQWAECIEQAMVQAGSTVT